MKGKLILERLEGRTLLSGNGWLDIENCIGALSPDVSLVHYDDNAISDSFDIWDTPWISPLSGYPSIHSDITTHKLKEDYRLTSSDTPFNLGLVYNGTVSTPTVNHLKVSMTQGGDWEFGSRPITLEEDNGQGNDLRRAISNGAGGVGIGEIPLDNLPADTYTTSTPYATPEVHFGPTADFDNNGLVDWVDATIMSSNWLNREGVTPASPGYLRGDITGANGLPDGIVNLLDYAELKRQASE
jgi:hypothetical protein